MRLEATPRSRQVLDQLVAALQSGEYPAGARLPSERDLASKIGVSRTSVREALAPLHAVGIIERQQGNGTYVRSLDPERLAHALYAVHDVEEPHEIFEWQEILEPPIALLAAAKAGPSDIEAMKAALEAMRAAVESSDRPSYSENDRRFHLAIANACNNRIIGREVAHLSELMSQQVWKSIKSYGVNPELERDYLLRSFQFHEQLFNAIANGDLLRIKSAFTYHYQHVREVVFEGGEDSQ